MFSGLRSSGPTHYVGYGSDGSSSGRNSHSRNASCADVCGVVGEWLGMFARGLWAVLCGVHAFVARTVDTVVRCVSASDDLVCGGGAKKQLNQWLPSLVFMSFMSLAGGLWYMWPLLARLTTVGKLAIFSALKFAATVTTLVFRSPHCIAPEAAPARDIEDGPLHDHSGTDTGSGGGPSKARSCCSLCWSCTNVGKMWLCFLGVSLLALCAATVILAQPAFHQSMFDMGDAADAVWTVNVGPNHGSPPAQDDDASNSNSNPSPSSPVPPLLPATPRAAASDPSASVADGEHATAPTAAKGAAGPPAEAEAEAAADGVRHADPAESVAPSDDAAISARGKPLRPLTDVAGAPPFTPDRSAGAKKLPLLKSSRAADMVAVAKLATRARLPASHAAPYTPTDVDTDSPHVFPTR